jgi:hypothetical protein
MWEDPIVAEVRQTRMELEKEGGNDFDTIYARAVEVQKGLAHRLISTPIGFSEENGTNAELERERA